MKKYFDFHGKPIYFTLVDNEWWVAIKPLCEALGINYNRQFQNLKEDIILSQLFAEQQIVAADQKLRKMLCLPEFYVYGWMFQIQSESESLRKYKWECYRVLYEHFKGMLSERQSLLHEKKQLVSERKEFEKKLSGNQDFQRYQQNLSREAKINTALRENDKRFISSQGEFGF